MEANRDLALGKRCLALLISAGSREVMDTTRSARKQARKWRWEQGTRAGRKAQNLFRENAAAGARTNCVNVRRQLNAGLSTVISEGTVGGEVLDALVGIHRDQNVTDVGLRRRMK